MPKAKSPSPENSIVAVDRFIQATRDSGYRSTASAVSELVDNSIEAGARRISILVEKITTGFTISVCDDGCGMDPFTLRQALRFGGSTRFNDRSGMGRYGMGLPNSSFSQARKIVVYTWKIGNKRSPRFACSVYRCYLDYDQILSGKALEVRRPKLVSGPPEACASKSGTLVQWHECDRVDFKRISTAVRRLNSELGRRFRYFLSGNVKITVNDSPVRPIDPLFLNPQADHNGAILYGTEIRYEVRANLDQPDPPIGVVKVRFSELPVRHWRNYSNELKRTMGITKGAGVSIIRSGREVDAGWFFMGKKRRENYDDWWRCEVDFEPILDEAFGLTHTKQQVQPRSFLSEVLIPDIEATARQLNSRVRAAHQHRLVPYRSSETEAAAAGKEQLLPPLPSGVDSAARNRMRTMFEKGRVTPSDGDSFTYRIVRTTDIGTSFFSYAMTRNMLALLVNDDHPFFRDLNEQLERSNHANARSIDRLVGLMLIAAVRSEASETNEANRKCIAKFRKRWSDVLASYLVS